MLCQVAIVMYRFLSERVESTRLLTCKVSNHYF